MPEVKKAVVSDLSDKEKRLIKIIRGLKTGELHITVAGGNPVRAEEIKRKIEL